jgi:DNA invertase Pin-like site-specific DNA recombinase
MSHYGYARVSTLDQDLTIQRAALKAAGCEVIRAEKASGTRRDGRTELQVLLDFLRTGDTLVVTRIDRLARSLKDLQDIVHELKGRGVALKATEQPVDTGTAAGKAFLDMLGVFAEFETNLRRERQLEGISAAKARGVTRAASRRSTPPKSAGCAPRRSLVPRRSRAASASAGPASIACSGSPAPMRCHDECSWRSTGPSPPRYRSGYAPGSANAQARRFWRTRL